MNDQIAAEYRELAQQFVYMCDNGDSKILISYRNKRITFFNILFEELIIPLQAGKDISLYLRKMVKTLIVARRFLDLATLFSRLKTHYEFGLDSGRFYPLFKTELKEFLNELFMASLTYQSSEIDTLFFEIMENDTTRFLELVSYVFKDQKLFNASLSPNIYKKFIAIADEDPKRFIMHTNAHFLSFYLHCLTTLPWVTKEHVEKWTQLFLSNSTNRRYIERIVKAMTIRPNFDILLLLMLSPREEPRGKSLRLLWEYFKTHEIPIKKYRTSIEYVLEKALTSHFYDFDQLSREQKTLITNILLPLQNEKLLSLTFSIIKRPNPTGDPKQQETKKIFIFMLGKYARTNDKIIHNLRELLKNNAIEETLKLEITRVLNSTSQTRQAIDDEIFEDNEVTVVDSIKLSKIEVDTTPDIDPNKED